MDYLEQNLNHLPFNVKVDLVRKLSRLVSGENGLKVVNARNGSPTMTCQLNGTETWLHSRDNPIAEGSAWANQINIQRGNIIVVFGFGLGYHLESLTKKAESYDGVTVLAIEPSVTLLKMALESRDLSALFKKPNFHLVAAENEADLQNHLNTKIKIGHLRDLQFQFFGPLFNCFPEYRQTVKQIRSYINAAFIDRNTYIHFGQEWTINSIKNIEHVLESRPVAELSGAFSGIPAIIVSAGPSLDKNIKLLQQAKGKAIITAIGQSFRPVINQGVEPDLVFVIDPGKGNMPLFDGIDSSAYHNCSLVYVPEAYFEVPPLFKNRLFVGMSPYSLKWFEEILQGDTGMMASGPSVANYALDFLVKSGASPIILIGQDLAFSEGRYHVVGAGQEALTVKKKYSDDKVLVESIDGATLETDREMHSMLNWFNSYISNLPPESVIIDATEGGAKINGTDIMPLSKALERYCGDNVNIAEIIGSADQRCQHSTGNWVDQMTIIKNTIISCEKAKQISNKGYQKGLDFQTEIANGILGGKKLEKILAEMKNNVKLIDEQDLFKKVASLMFEEIYRVFEESMSMAAREDYNTRERGLAIAKGYQYYFTRVKEAALLCEKLLKEYQETTFQQNGV